MWVLRNLNELVMVMGYPENVLYMGILGRGLVPEIYNEFLCFRCFELKVFVKAPSDCLVYLLMVLVLLCVINPIMFVSSAYLRMITDLWWDVKWFV